MRKKSLLQSKYLAYVGKLFTRIFGNLLKACFILSGLVSFRVLSNYINSFRQCITSPAPRITQVCPFCGIFSSSRVMAVCAPSKNVNSESLKWITDKMFRLFQYDVDLHLFKRTAVDDSIFIGVSCTPVKTNDLHWLQRLEHVKGSGYEYVGSAPSLERLDDGTSIRVNATGQYVVPNSGVNSLR